MSQCLRRPTIVKNICHQAYEGGYDPDCRAVVAALSATCRTIYAVARGVLWSRIFSLRPLIKCMPPDVWAESLPGDGGLRSAVCLTRPPDAPEWHRFLANAALVQSFKRFGLDPDLDDETYRTLCLYRPGHTPLLPNLRELIWEEPDADVFEYGYQLLGPKLTTLYLGQPPSDTLLLPILRSLHVKCPELRYLSVQCRSSIGPVDAAASHSISQLQHLETIDFALPLLDDALLHLARLPSLSVAKVFIPRIPEVHDRLLSLASCVFPALTAFHLSSICLEPSLAHLIRLCSSTQLAEVSLSTAHDPPASAVHEFISVFTTSPFKETLSAVTLSFPIPSSIPLMLSLNALPPLDRPECALGASILMPLSACSELTELEVTSFFTALDDDFIRLLANAFPRLQSLRLMPPYNAGRVSEVTLEGLLPVFRQCPDITHLAVPVDASVPPRPWHEPMRASQLLTLDVGDAPISAPDDVAAFLSAYCTDPAFSVVAANANEGDHKPEHMRRREIHSAMWGQVTRLVRLFVEVRSRERDHWMSILRRQESALLSPLPWSV
ncbi:hypothetical protein BD413DRAFT_491354 [Trametes elegans]|nr:hypothetical protein BD413DRAFT_491354 [Trametes elegans]